MVVEVRLCVERLNRHNLYRLFKMNKIYRTIWNESLGAWVAASELESARGKSSKSTLSVAVAAALIAVGASKTAYAQVPCGPTLLVQCVQSGVVGSLNNPVAVGATATATGGSAAALGASAVASGDNSVAVGSNAKSSSGSSVAVGNRATASGGVTIAIGLNSTATAGTSGSGSIAIGPNAISNANGVGVNNGSPIAIGYAANATGAGSQIAIGDTTTASGTDTIVIGNRASTVGGGIRRLLSESRLLPSARIRLCSEVRQVLLPTARL
ncbi:hypothetical protein KEH56_11930 [Burkholderia cenocepacia]|uniref:ESPR-type extended signal peptide-containing protein n=1 Tax=Burkholderia cenocepacia TaxID=95486 RepID=UPI001BAC40EB|nr:hypothetical protein KEH56_11930 [Burkholderia cenocepacia]